MGGRLRSAVGPLLVLGGRRGRRGVPGFRTGCRVLSWLTGKLREGRLCRAARTVSARRGGRVRGGSRTLGEPGLRLVPGKPRLGLVPGEPGLGLVPGKPGRGRIPGEPFARLLAVLPDQLPYQM